MTIKIPEADLLELLGENGEHWMQGAWYDDESMCLHGAIRRCSPQPGDAFLIEQVAARQGWGTGWNDAHDTDWNMIRQRLAHVEVTDADLADTFGPQWEHVVALVRRAAVLTADEVQQLIAAWVAVWDAARVAVWVAARDAVWVAVWDAARNDAQDAAWDAARVAAWVAVWDAARYAARDAAWDAARYAAWAAARDAARALVARDLIGQHGFTQEHYDLLTDPWVSVIGPVHPDDHSEEARRG
jgi:hypothetical protein